MRQRHNEGLRVGIGLALAVLAVVVLAVSVAMAHDAPSGWRYPTICCSPGDDCNPVHTHEIEVTQQGYYIPALDRTVPFDAANSSPDGDYHYCTRDDAERGEIIRRSVKEYEVMDRSTLCFWAPRNGL